MIFGSRTVNRVLLLWQLGWQHSHCPGGTSLLAQQELLRHGCAGVLPTQYLEQRGNHSVWHFPEQKTLFSQRSAERLWHEISSCIFQVLQNSAMFPEITLDFSAKLPLALRYDPGPKHRRIRAILADFPPTISSVSFDLWACKSKQKASHPCSFHLRN